MYGLVPFSKFRLLHFTGDYIRGIFSRSVGNILARPFDTYYRGLEADTATYRSDAVLYVSECLIVNI